MGYKRGCTCGFCCVGSFLPQCSLLFGPLRENRRLRMPSSCSRLWHSAQMTYPQCCTRTHPRLTAGFCIDSTPISDDRAAGTASARKNPFVGGSPASDPVLGSFAAFRLSWKESRRFFHCFFTSSIETKPHLNQCAWVKANV